MARVGHELSDPRLAVLAGAQGVRDVLEHVVERRTDLADLGPRVGILLGHAFGQRHLAAVEGELGHPRGRRGDPSQRPQAPADDGGGHEGGEDETEQGDQGHDPGEPQDGVVHPGHGQAGDHQVARPGLRGEQPVLVEARPEVQRS